MILLKRSTTPETYEIIMNSLFMRSKHKWFVAADIVCEQEVRISKEVYKAKGGSFRWTNLLRHTSLTAGTLYDTKMAFLNGHIDDEVIKRKGKHYDPSMNNDIVGLAEIINHYRIMDSENPPLQTIVRPDPYRMGWHKPHHSDLKKVVSYMYDNESGADVDDMAAGMNENVIMDSIGATPDDVDLDVYGDGYDKEGVSIYT